MITCPDCQHQNFDLATYCEACQAPLLAITPCPNCGESTQANARFCGKCGFRLQPVLVDHPELEALAPQPEFPSALASRPRASEEANPPDEQFDQRGTAVQAPVPPPATFAPVASGVGSLETQLQQQTAHLLHVQSNTAIALPQQLAVIHIGKPNDQIPPDIDVAGFPHSEVVSRIHADIRAEADTYFVEDVGSANGTYVNHTLLPAGNRHRLRHGDRIALGKGDLVTFLFQLH